MFVVHADIYLDLPIEEEISTPGQLQLFIIVRVSNQTLPMHHRRREVIPKTLGSITDGNHCPRPDSGH
jgi:hypothetical protein